jgi:hypothetical protein
MRRMRDTVVVIATLLLPLPGQAQVLTPPRVRVDTLIRLPQPAPLQILGSSAHICLDCHGWAIRPGWEPAYIIKDSAARVLAMVPPGDSSYFRDPRHSLAEPEMIAAVEVLRDTSLVRVLGRGFDNGLVIITLTPGGTVIWRSAAARKETPP